MEQRDALNRVRIHYVCRSYKSYFIHRIMILRLRIPWTVNNCAQCVKLYLLVSYGRLEFFFSLFRCDSTAKLKAQLNGLKSLTSDSTTFKKIYRYAFDFCRVSVYSYNSNSNDNNFNDDDDDDENNIKNIKNNN